VEKTEGKYRSDIEGLRAISVLFVIASHADVPWFDGGFIGVDIFFVISGYLITSLLLKDINSSGTVSFSRFYAGRLRRLLPALAFMILITSLVSLALLSPYEHIPQAATGGYAVLWLSNFHFSFEELRYFDPSADENVYLHTWSLGVEEQFYLVWPLLILSIVGAWKWQGRQNNVQRLVLIMAIMTVLGLMLSVFLSYYMPTLGFYLMPSRAWQFSLGALAFLWPVWVGINNPGITGVVLPELWQRVVRWGGWLGFISIFLAVFLINPDMTYPGCWSLIPSLGGALILMGGAVTSRSVVSQVLSLTPLVWIGRISYSWYLWHWSILVLGDRIFPDSQMIEKWVLVLVSLFFAIFSYFVVEAPVRKNKKLTAKPALTLAIAFLIMGLIYALSSAWESAAKEWIELPEQHIFSQVHFDLPVTYTMGCDQWYRSSELKFCIFGDVNAKHTAVLMGDSIGTQWSPALAQRYVKKNWRFIVFTKSSCPMIDEVFFYRRIGREYTECSIWRNTAVDWIKNNRPDIVFMGSALPRFTENQWTEGSARILSEISDSVSDIYIIRAAPALNFDGPYCLSQQQWRQKWLPQGFQLLSDCSSKYMSHYSDQVHKWLLLAADRFDNVRVVDMNPVICPQNHCNAFRDGRAIYRDAMHLSKSYVWSIAREFFDAMKSK